MTEPRDVTAPIRCPVCDKDSSRNRSSDVVHSEPATHCEWCGAEYPLPESVEPAATTPSDRETKGQTE